MNCPGCHKPLVYEDINIQTDVAQCHNCHLVFKISENLGAHPDDGFDMDNPPNGTWIKREFNGLIIGASTRSPLAFFLVPFMLVWSGIALGSIYGTQIMNGQFNLFSSLMGIPFILGSIIFWALTLMAIAGKVELTLDNEGGKIFTGLGKIGMKKSFTWVEVKTVREGNLSVKYPASLILEGKKRISFGTGLSAARRYYLFRSLQLILINKNIITRVF